MVENTLPFIAVVKQLNERLSVSVSVSVEARLKHPSELLTNDLLLFNSFLNYFVLTLADLRNEEQFLSHHHQHAFELLSPYQSSNRAKSPHLQFHNQQYEKQEIQII